LIDYEVDDAERNLQKRLYAFHSNASLKRDREMKNDKRQC
jgi:hypothetical protein